MAQAPCTASVSPCVGTWNCLSSGCVRGGVGECQLVPVVFHFFSGAEQGKHLWEETAESRKDKVPFLLLPACCALAVWIEALILVWDKLVFTPLPNVFQLVKRVWDQPKEEQALNMPDPSQCYFEALSFLASRYAVIPLIQENKHMRNIYEKKQVTHKWE